MSGDTDYWPAFSCCGGLAFHSDNCPTRREPGGPGCLSVHGRGYYLRHQAPGVVAGPPAFVWCDLETTGLDAQCELILSLGLLITDAQFNEVARGEWTIDPREPLVHRTMDPYVRDMHTKNGLLARIERGECLPLEQAEEYACDFLDLHLGPPRESIKERPPMAGNSVSFDREFVREHCPDLIQRFNYRLLDVSSFKVLAMAQCPGAREWNASRDQNIAHTPIADLVSSIAELNHWKEELRK